jgi:hypothetical protein
MHINTNEPLAMRFYNAIRVAEGDVELVNMLFDEYDVKCSEWDDFYIYEVKDGSFFVVEKEWKSAHVATDRQNLVLYFLARRPNEMVETFREYKNGTTTENEEVESS